MIKANYSKGRTQSHRSKTSHKGVMTARLPAYFLFLRSQREIIESVGKFFKVKRDRRISIKNKILAINLIANENVLNY
jgi:hypothetical protein